MQLAKQGGHGEEARGCNIAFSGRPLGITQKPPLRVGTFARSSFSAGRKALATNATIDWEGTGLGSMSAKDVIDTTRSLSAFVLPGG